MNYHWRTTINKRPYHVIRNPGWAHGFLYMHDLLPILEESDIEFCTLKSPFDINLELKDSVGNTVKIVAFKNCNLIDATKSVACIKYDNVDINWFLD